MPRLVARRVALAGLELNNVSHSIVKNARSGYDDISYQSYLIIRGCYCIIDIVLRGSRLPGHFGIWSMSRAGYNGYNDLR